MYSKELVYLAYLWERKTFVQELAQNSHLIISLSYKLQRSYFLQ